MNPEVIGGTVLIGFIAITLWFNTPASNMDGKQPVVTRSAFHLVRTAGESDGVLDLRDRGGVVLGSYVLRDRQLYETPEQAESGVITAALIRDYYLIDPGFDLGVWGGWSQAGSDSDDDDDISRFQAGFRFSPARLLYGTVAPDLVASADVGGAGLTFYPPTHLVGQHWRHLGVGAWYVAPFDGSDPGWAFGISFSTR